MNRENVLKAQLEAIEFAEQKANAPDTLQEDSAFINRMKKIPFYRFENAELQRLWRIAERGLQAQRELEGKQ